MGYRIKARTGAIMSGSGMSSLFTIFVASALAVVSFASCTVDQTFVREDYDARPEVRMKRIVIGVESGAKSESSKNDQENALITPDDQVQELYLNQAIRFISFSKNLMIKGYARNLDSRDLAKICKRDGVEGVLLNRFQRLQAADGEVDLQLKASLVDCKSQETVWYAIGSNHYDSLDEDLEGVIRSYTVKYGESGKAYAAPFYLFIRRIYDSLPNPVLSPGEIDEKIDSDAVGPDEIQ